MMERFDLPPILADQVRALRRRSRALRILSRLPAFLLAFALVPLVLFLADRLWPMPLGFLRVGLGAYLLLAMVLALRMFWGLQSGIHSKDLSLAAEKAFPDLAERFSTVVSLSEQGEEVQGSPALREVLADQAVAGTRDIDLRGGLPLGPAWKRAIRAAGVLALVVAGTLWLPSARVFAMRLFRSWHDPYHGFSLRLEPGSGHVAQGQAVEFQVNLERLDEVTELPSTCLLVLEDGGATRRMKVETKDGKVFRGRIPALERDLSFRAEAGDLATATHRLTAVAPLRAAAGYPKVRVEGPAYVPVENRAIREDAGTVLAWEFGVLELALRFERPVQGLRCIFEWEDGPGRKKLLRSLEPEMDGEGLEATARLALEREGSVHGRMEVEAEGGVVFRWPLPEIRVRRDRPPEFLRVEQAVVRPGSTTPAEAAPDDVLRFSLGVRDDIGLDRVDLEYRIDDGPIVGVPLMAGGKAATFQASPLFSLEGKVKPDQQIRFRMRAVDTRRLARASVRVAGGGAVPEQDLSPQQTTYPPGQGEASAWMPLRIVPRQTPLEERHILARRDGIEKRLRAILQKLVEARAQVQKARLAGHQQAALDGAARREVDLAQERIGAIIRDLLEVADSAAADPGWQELTQRVADIAGEEMARSSQALRDAGRIGPGGEKREAAFRRSENELEQASRKVTDLLRLNQDLAQARLDEFRLEDLGRREEDLAGKAGEEKKSPVLAKLHEGLMARLEKLMQESPLLKAALEDIERARMERAAAELERLVKEQAALASRGEPDLPPALKDRLKDLAGKQKALAGKVDQWRREAGSGVEAQRSAAEAAEELLRARPQPALVRQAQAAEELDRQGALLESPAPAETLRQGLARLLRLQEGLHRDLEQLGHDFPMLTMEQAKARLRGIAEKQKNLAGEMTRLQTTVENRQRPNLAQASSLVEMTARDLFTRPALNGFLRMEEAMQALRESLARIPDEPAGPAPGDPKAAARRAEQAAEARELAAAQRSLREEVRKALEAGLPAPAAQDAARQEDLRNRMDQVLKDLKRAAGTKQPAPGEQAMKDAVAALQQAKDLLAKGAAGKEPGKGEPMAKEAGRMLEQAAKKVKDAAGAMALKQGKGKETPVAPEAVKMLRQGQEAMAQAQKMLEGKSPAQAGKAMNQAATALRQAARQMRTKMAGGAKRLPTIAGDPAGTLPGRGEEEGRLVSPGRLDAKKGSVWGELPGELKTRLLLDLRQRYGEDYGPIIQRYFRRLAEPIEGERRK